VQTRHQGAARYAEELSGQRLVAAATSQCVDDTLAVEALDFAEEAYARVDYRL
jgi:hypothetical protein